ncbi:hemerythrin domain-containing protein [Nocardia heshunensis]
MNTQSRVEAGPDIQEMVVVHRWLRELLRRTPDLVRTLRPGDRARTEFVVGHLRDVLEAVEDHHTNEDDHLWPVLSPRVTLQAGVVHRMEEQHRNIEWLATEVANLLPALTADPETGVRERVAGFLEDLRSALSTHMDDEERSILPLVSKYLTAEEWEDFGRAAAANTSRKPPSKKLAELSGLLAVATPAERHIFLDRVPGPVRLLWRFAGRPSYRRTRERLYAPVEA